MQYRGLHRLKKKGLAAMGGAVITAVGAVCFFLSDNILVWRKLSGNQGVEARAVLLLLYYSAVLLIASGPLF